jgi:fimbrial isopeptide formation D2 family protein/LPXTG-motif cell wall-anchored protein
MKKTMALVLAVVLALALAIPAMAAGEKPDITDTNGTFTYADLKHDSTTSSLTVKNTGSQAHTFTLYQIFVGDVDDEGTLSNIVWGSGVTTAGQTQYGIAATKAKAVTTAADAKAFADDLVENEYLTGGVTKPDVAANANAEWTGLNPGYYLVLDETSGLGDKDDSVSAYVMQVIGTVTRNAKIDTPDVTKEVKETNDSTAAEGEYGETADYDVGDKVPYKITGTLPSNYAEYETYKTYNFKDTLSDGLDAPTADSITIMLNGTTDIKSNFDVSVNDKVITITLKSDKDLKTIATNATDTIVVEYEATINGDAVKGGTGNVNTVELEFSNNPNKGGEGDKGKTDDTAVVFTYDVEVNKVTGTGNDKTDLAGAGFALYKKYATVPDGKEAAETIAWDNGKQTFTPETGDNWVLVDTIDAGSTTKFTFEGVDAGDYLLVETTTPAGYNSIAPKSFTIEVTITDGAVTNAEGTGEIDLGTLTVSNAITGVTTEIVNEKGSTLPSTGGIGTKIFYTMGAVLVIGAGVVLVSRKRAGE